jgi:Protein of unknown function (DUF1549)/Protein of unknown function (DUF1553)/Planctomycete cytochrome C
MRSIRFLCSVLLAALTTPVSAAPEFERDVLPILTQHCLKCHKAGAAKGGLDLRAPAHLLNGGESGPAIVVGKPDQSLLLKRIAEGSMPPGKKPGPSALERQVLTDWVRSLSAKSIPIADNPPVSDYWAFRRLAMPAVPAVKDSTRLRTAVDAFVLAKLEAKGLSFAPDAERLTLLRRISFDLTGLPPSPEEADAFLADKSPDAYEKLVDRLLASPHFGERWGRHWLDVAGYADTTSTDNDVNGGKIREGMWRYRDYVVQSLNNDKPFDRFLLEQLAGDQLFTWTKDTSFTPEQKELLIATGFLRTAVDGTHNVERNRPLERYQVLHDTVEILGSNLFGLTVACARCHDHKYDPITQRDYYRLMACLTPAYNPRNWLQPQVRHLTVTTPQEAEEIKRFNADLDRRAGELGGKQAKLRRPHEQRLSDAKYAALPETTRADFKAAQATGDAKRTEAQKSLIEKVGPLVNVSREEVTASLSPDEGKTDADLENQINDLRVRRRDVEKIQALWDVGPPPATFLLRQGSHETPGREVEPGLPAVLGGMSSLPEGPRRLALARALTKQDSLSAGLIARALVNRLWHHHFGRGIVATPGNLGKSGAVATHPELLEYLAAELIRNGWRVKPIHRLIVTSTVYRQAARVKPGGSPDPENIDPENHLLWRSRLRRLESEAIRDALLAVSGQLDRRIGGPFVPLEGRADGTVTLARSQPDPNGPRRRSLYLYARRNFNLSLLAVFDQPLMATNCSCRQTSAVVPQALTLLNDATVLDAAESLARRALAKATTPAERVRYSFRLALGRSPTAAETAAATELLQRHARRYAELSSDDAALRSLTHVCQVLLCTNEFLYIE